MADSFYLADYAMSASRRGTGRMCERSDPFPEEPTGYDIAGPVQSGVYPGESDRGGEGIEWDPDTGIWCPRDASERGFPRQLRALALSPFVGQRLTMLVSKERYTDLEALTPLTERGQVVPVIDRTY
jgi:hypothetical protein